MTTQGNAIARFKIRPAEKSDAKALLAVHRRSILELGVSAYAREECESWAAGLTSEGYVEAMTTGGEDYLVALSGTELVGFCSFKHDEVMGLFVVTEASGVGLGTRLLEHAETVMRNRGEVSFRLTAALSALPFYQRRGYCVRQRKPWKTRGGREIEVCDMQKRLS